MRPVSFEQIQPERHHRDRSERRGFYASSTMSAHGLIITLQVKDFPVGSGRRDFRCEQRSVTDRERAAGRKPLLQDARDDHRACRPLDLPVPGRD
jgi:hypothetical protein